MFEIKYKFSDSNFIDIANLNDTSLRYNLFLGNITLQKNKDLILLDWCWIPILDFALCLVSISDTLSQKTNGEKELDFTESDEKLIFQKTNNNIKIITSFSNEILEINFEDFKKVVKEFYKNFISDVVKQNHELKNNKIFLKYLKE